MKKLEKCIHLNLLFISSYIPLYVLMIFKNILERISNNGRFENIMERVLNATLFDEINDFAIVILLMLSISSFMYLKISLSKINCDKKYTVVSIRDETSNCYFNYISIYLLSCLGLTLNSIVDCFVFLFVMIIVGYIYISNNMVYMNPVINFMGYKIFDAEVCSVNTSDKNRMTIIMAPKDLILEQNMVINATINTNFMVVDKVERI